MTVFGPPLEQLTRRLAECPADFLEEPRLGAAGSIHVDAVVADVLDALGGGLLESNQAASLAPRSGGRPERNRLRLTLIACWLLYDPWFCESAQFAGAARTFLVSGLAEAARLTQAPQFVNEPDRREELARLCLLALGLRPAGETENQAQDRLATLNTAERQRVLAAARAAEERAREIRRKMAEEAARDAEAKVMRE